MFLQNVISRNLYDSFYQHNKKLCFNYFSDFVVRMVKELLNFVADLSFHQRFAKYCHFSLH